MELQFLDWLYTLHRPLLDRIMVGITSLGNGGIFWIVLALLLMLSKRTRLWGITMGVAMLVGFVIVNLGLKPLVHRIRPYEVSGFEALLTAKPKDFSFPSGHSQVSFAGAFVLYRMDRVLVKKGRLGIPAIVLASLIAFSRLYLYLHYPTDVAVGMVCGVLSGWIAVRVFQPWFRSLGVCRRCCQV